MELVVVFLLKMNLGIIILLKKKKKVLCLYIIKIRFHFGCMKMIVNSYPTVILHSFWLSSLQYSLHFRSTQALMFLLNTSRLTNHIELTEGVLLIPAEYKDICGSRLALFCLFYSQEGKVPIWNEEEMKRKCRAVEFVRAIGKATVTVASVHVYFNFSQQQWGRADYYCSIRKISEQCLR